MLFLGILIVVLLLSGVLLDKLFDDQVLLLVSLILGIGGCAAGFLTRGTLSAGRPLQGLLGASWAPTARCGWRSASSSPWPAPRTAGLVRPRHRPRPVRRRRHVAVAASTASSRTDRRRSRASSPPPWRPSCTASVLSFTLLNIGPLAIDFLGTEAEKSQASHFGNAVFVARVPLFLFQAVQAALLPKLAALAERGQFVELRQGMKRLLLATGAIGRPRHPRRLHDRAVRGDGALRPGLRGRQPHPRTARPPSAFYMLATVVGQAVIALRGSGWWPPRGPPGSPPSGSAWRCSPMTSSSASRSGWWSAPRWPCWGMSIALIAKLRSGAVVDEGSLVEAAPRLPLEP